MIDEKKLLEKIDNNVPDLTSDQIYKIAEVIVKQPKLNEWIPCSERLPECEWGYETKALMYQMKDTGTIEVGYYGEGGRMRDRYFRTYRDSQEGVDVSAVIAWQPLPEPYRE